MDFPTMRAAQEAEISLARMAVAQAAHDAQTRLNEAAIGRIRSAAPQLFAPGKPGAPKQPAPGAAGASSADDNLAGLVMGLTDQVNQLAGYVKLHNQILTKLAKDHPELVK
jgi:hypothetical protein